MEMLNNGILGGLMLPMSDYGVSSIDTRLNGTSKVGLSRSRPRMHRPLTRFPRMEVARGKDYFSCAHSKTTRLLGCTPHCNELVPSKYLICCSITHTGQTAQSIIDDRAANLEDGGVPQKTTEVEIEKIIRGRPSSHSTNVRDVHKHHPVALH